MDLESFRWLLTPEGQAALATAEQLDGDRVDPIRAGELLRRSVAPEQAATAMAQAELRVAAVSKLGADAGRMYFTRDGLEQSTRHEIARHR